MHTIYHSSYHRVHLAILQEMRNLISYEINTWGSCLGIDETFFCDFGDIEVSQLEHTVGYENISAFQISMNNFDVM